MRPLHLEMEGFGAFRQACDIDFSDVDLLALVGATGSGKSTIIDAITFALYGTVARYDDNRAVAPVINQTSTRARVRLDFDAGGQAYTAVRVVQRLAKGGATTKEARLECGGDVLSADARHMTTVVEELLGLDVEQFNRTVVLPQGRFADFLHDSPAKRQETLLQLLGLEMYRRIGQTARQRAAAANNQIEALRPELEEGETELTDEHRVELEAAVIAIADMRQRFGVDREAIASVRQEGDRLTARLGVVAGHLDLVSAIIVPEDVGELDRRHAAATARRNEAAAAFAEARDARRRAAEAMAAGPDLARCTVQLNARRAAVQLMAERRSVAIELASATETLTVARLAADAVTSRQRELESAVEQARHAEDLAQSAVAGGPDPAQLANWLQLYDRRASCAASLEACAIEETATRTALEPLVEAALAATAAEDEARRHLDLVKDRVGAAAYADLLSVGQPCPLCLQDVRHLPSHDLDDERQQAEAASDRALTDRKATDQQRDLVQERYRHAAAAATAQRNVLAALDAELTGVVTLQELHEQQAAAEHLKGALDSAAEAVRDVAAAAARHGDDPGNVTARERASAAHDLATRLTYQDENLADRVEQMKAELIDVPDEALLVAAVAEAGRLADERDAADTEYESAVTERDAAAAALEGVDAEIRASTQLLNAVRDRVAALGVPSVSGTDVAADWASLTAWADEQSSSLDAERERVATQLAEAGDRLVGIEAEARQRCTSVLTVDVSAVDLTTVAERLVARETEARGSLIAFDEQRDKLASLRERIEALIERAAVADTLGHLLRSDGFESWLMQSALEGLVEAASVRLRELSGGQFGLELDDRTFAVRDHSNADELRSARTLSGGETFLASLSLALALADATAELAAEGAPAIESIFLDEGFGTLDPQTLDTVATAIEELGASGRMVGIVTHIRELADRMPVRLEVTKTAATSTVERIEV